MKYRLREVLYYSRQQRRALIFLYLCCLLLLATQVYLRYHIPQTVVDLSDYEDFINEWKRQDRLKTPMEQQITPFPFDPNTASDSVLAALGLRKKLRTTLINFRTKGGTFSTPPDLLHIYGMDRTIYEELKDYVQVEEGGSGDYTGFQNQRQPLSIADSFDLNRISEDHLALMGLDKREIKGIIGFRAKFRPFRSVEDLYQVYNLDSSRASALIPFARISKDEEQLAEEPLTVILELNQADSAEFLQLKGVGPYFAGRMVSYRQQLGGYFSKAQLLEIPGLDSVYYNQIKHQLILDTSTVVRMNINSASYEQLCKHPYLKKEVVKNIIRFREQYRQYNRVEELMNIELIDGVLFSKIANYLSAE